MKRNRFIIKYYISLVIIFLLQKPLFILFTKNDKISLFDYISVTFHGLPLDLSTAGYLCIIPIIIIFISYIFRTNFSPNKILKPYNIFIAIILSIIFITDISLYPFWNYKLDSTIFNYLDSPQEAIASVSAFYIIIRVLFIAIISYLIYKRLNKITPNEFKNKKILISFFSTIAICGLLFLSIRGGIKESTMNTGKVYYSTNQYFNHSAVNPAFSLFSSIGKNGESNLYNFYNPDEAEKLIGEHFNGANSNYQDNTLSLLNKNNPNILIIIMESFGSTYTSSNATPNFWKIAKDGVLFDKMYCNSYRTDRGVVSTLNGTPSFPKFSIMKNPRVVESLPSIASKLKSNSYNTYFLYGGDINFTNTKGYLITTGYDNIISDIDFNSNQRRENKWGVNDEKTFNYLLTNIENNNYKEPWFQSFLTLSSHEPFKVPFNGFENDVYNAGAYTDYHLGKFIDSLKRKKEIWDNLLVIILPDHNLLYNTTYTEPNYFRCEMIWTGGVVNESIRGYKFDNVMNQSDLAATLLSQLNLVTSDFKYSRNVFSKEYIPSAFCCYNNGFLIVDSLSSVIYDLEGEIVANKTPQTLSNEDTEKKIEKGKALLQFLYNRITQ